LYVTEAVRKVRSTSNIFWFKTKLVELMSPKWLAQKQFQTLTTNICFCLKSYSGSNESKITSTQDKKGLQVQITTCKKSSVFIN